MEKISHYMSDQLHTIGHDSSVLEAAVKFRDLDVHALIVTQGLDFVGIITEVDIARKVVANGLNPNETVVINITQTPVVKLDKNLPMPVALQGMIKHNIRHIIITDQTKIVGLLSIKDIASYYCNTTKDPILHFWSNYECLLNKASFDYAIDKLLKEMVDYLGGESKTGKAIKDNKPIAEIASIAQEEGLEDLKQILQLSID